MSLTIFCCCRKFISIQLFIHVNFTAYIKEIIKFITRLNACTNHFIEFIIISQSHCQIVCWLVINSCLFNIFKEKNCINPKWFIKFQGRLYKLFTYSFVKTRILNLLTCATLYIHFTFLACFLFLFKLCSVYCNLHRN